MDNPVGSLQELCVKHGQHMPVYTEGKMTGAAHQPNFSIHCSAFNCNEWGMGSTKKEAKKLAASKVLSLILSESERAEENVMTSSNKPQLMNDLVFAPPSINELSASSGVQDVNKNKSIYKETTTSNINELVASFGVQDVNQNKTIYKVSTSIPKKHLITDFFPKLHKSLSYKDNDKSRFEKCLKQTGNVEIFSQINSEKLGDKCELNEVLERENSQFPTLLQQTNLEEFCDTNGQQLIDDNSSDEVLEKQSYQQLRIKEVMKLHMRKVGYKVEKFKESIQPIKKLMKNPISELMLICSTHGLPEPDFQLLPLLSTNAHFTVCCTINDYSKTGVGKEEQAAKLLAAESMLSFLKQTFNISR